MVRKRNKDQATPIVIVHSGPPEEDIPQEVLDQIITDPANEDPIEDTYDVSGE